MSYFLYDINIYKRSFFPNETYTFLEPKLKRHVPANFERIYLIAVRDKREVEH